MDSFDPKAAAERMLNSPHAVALGLALINVEPGRITVRTPWREDLVGDPDTQVIAGGVITTLLDHSCGAAVSTVRANGGAPTLDLRIDYMRAAAPRADVIATAHCYKLTRSIAFVRAVAWDVDESDPVATAQAAFALPPERAA